MEYQTYLELRFLSASDLKRSWLSGNKTEAVVWIDSTSKKSSGVICDGGCNVQWQEKMIFPLTHTDTTAQQVKWLTVEIRSLSALGVNHLLGTATIPLAELAVDLQKEPNSTQTYQLVLPSGKRYGSLSFLGKIVALESSGLSASLPSASPASLLRSPDARAQSNVLDGPPSHCFVEAYTEEPTMDSVRPLPSCLPQNFTNDEAYTHRSSPCTSCRSPPNPSHTPWGLTSYSPIVYPPVHLPPSYLAAGVSTLCSEGVTPYPPFPNTPYPSSVSIGQHVKDHDPYLPVFVHPHAAPHHSQISYPTPPLYPYAAYSNPVYPPPYPPLQDDYRLPHLAY